MADIRLKTDISQQDAQWVIEYVLPKKEWRIDRTTLGWLKTAHNLVFEGNVEISNCSCDFRTQHLLWYSRLDQYETQIREIAYPVVLEEENILEIQPIQEIEPQIIEIPNEEYKFTTLETTVIEKPKKGRKKK